MFFLLLLLNFRNINGFLNTGKGGTIYLGIVDDGKVKGLHLTQFQVSCYPCSVNGYWSECLWAHITYPDLHE